jgi:redox-sensitive bicupin YhaK (pirin superfamily)
LCTADQVDLCMAKLIYHPATSRGKIELGWVISYPTFSFGNYYNPERISFGALRVLNDDVLKGGEGFGDHPHDNMEIISIPLQGGLKHVDSLANVAIIADGDIQVMSAGTGVFHEEHNHDEEEAAQFLQIWLYPDRLNVEPRYDQLKLDQTKREGRLQQILSPDKEDEGVWVYQNAWFYLGSFQAGNNFDYEIKAAENGVYIFVISGSVEINGQVLTSRDGLGISDTDAFTVKVLADAEILVMDVPMQTYN